MATRNKKSSNPLSLSVRPDGVAVVTIDVVGEAQNTLRGEFTPAFNDIQDQIAGADDVRAVVIISGKKGSFVAGADIEMLRAAKTKEEVTALSTEGQEAFARLAASPVPVVAAIDGACLGGGLELALACSARVATDERHTKLGLPEVMLGLLPGAGGTQRLPRLVGIASALDLMLTGKQLNGKRAKKLGLVNDVVPASILLETAAKLALKLADQKPRATPPAKRVANVFGSLTNATDLQRLALEENPIGRRVLFSQARKQLLSKSRGNYPAPEYIIDVVETGYEEGVAAGYAAEAKKFGELAMTNEATGLMSLFFGITGLKKDSGVDSEVAPRELSRIGVLGAGLMGAGIAFVTVDKANIDVRLKDRDDEGLTRGLSTVNDIYMKRVKRRRMSRTDATRAMNRITTTTDYSGFASSDIVIEAVFEDLGLKHRVLAEVEAATNANTIFASNTSSIPISRIAEGAKRPENVIGMHYFSPVDKMQLLEVIVTPQTSDEVTATVVKLGKDQGKHVIVVQDGVGFYTSRILAPYMNEAAFVISEGVPIDVVDEALMDWGYPVGPVTLLDEVGIDVAAKIGPIMVEAFGDRMAPPGAADALVADGRLGRKSKRGFYRYDVKAKKGKKLVDESVYELLGITPNKSMDGIEIAERCGLLMVNEAALCLQEGILRSPRDGDIGAVFGLGFPPFTGGPFRYVDQVGAAWVVKRLEELRAQYGDRFAPAENLVEMAKSGATFY
ncbi:MAG: 3-hydroxyacyl-CoA dehydrogenase/enoyl-CoA hydratase/3-hydroxybutyryl-CoA epimerase [Flavobacteriales bacterium]|jgi:3-hydroxyacyl-CoA dehydrogenase/enoyl-CoA hydratase/3-hydroxybutyryl-CoA epimerase